MKRTHFKIRVDSVDAKHVHFTIFVGKEGQTLANTGSLCMDHPEYQLFASGLLLGAKNLSYSNHALVTIDEQKWADYHKENKQ